MASPLLELSDVSKRFGGVQALDQVSLTVDGGSVHGIIGSNGAGKSTLLSLVSGAQRVSSGEIRLDGSPTTGLDAPRVAQLGVARAHQVPKPFRQMTVRQHLDVAARLHRRRRAERHELIDRTLGRCALADRAERPAASLGLLDLKRLGVARALATNPRLLLLDEIGAGLTGDDLDAVIELVEGVRADGVTIVMVEHIQGLIRRLADRVTVLEWGRVLREGTPEEIAADPEVVRAYLGTAGEVSPADLRSGGERPEPVLQIDGLSVTYGALPALQNCTLQVGRAEVVAVVGANGAGKSTLARAVAGLNRAQSGRVVLDGRDVTGAPAHVRARRGLALCPEGRRLFGDMTVEDNLRVAARRGRGVAAGASIEGAVTSALSLFPEVDEFRSAAAGKLSGGQQQMVAICRALVADPALVIFDELSLGLAPRLAQRILEAIPRLRDRGVGVLLIEQNVSQALRVCDHVYVLERSRVTFAGPPAALADEATLRAAYYGAGTRGSSAGDQDASEHQPPGESTS